MTCRLLGFRARKPFLPFTPFLLFPCGRHLFFALSLLIGTLVFPLGPSVLANPPHSFKQYLPSLVRAQQVWVTVDLSTRSEATDLDAFKNIVTRRMAQVGYSVVEDPGLGYDVKVEFTCSLPENSSEQKESRQEGRRGSPWAGGPPCHMRYVHHGTIMAWQRIDRVVYNLGVQTVQRLQQEAVGQDPSLFVRKFLEQYEYPILFAAEWGQTERLLRLLKHSNIEVIRKKVIFMLLGETHATKAIPCLKDFLEDETFIQPAIMALGHFGVAGRSS